MLSGVVNNIMRAREITKKTNQAKQYLVKIKLFSPGKVNIVDTIVYATTPQWARKIVRAQYNTQGAIVGQPREIKQQKRR
jgi:uncharacterized heparinase superfamily protein